MTAFEQVAPMHAYRCGCGTTWGMDDEPDYCPGCGVWGGPK